MTQGMTKQKLVFSPEGCHMLVDDIVTEVSLEHRAEASGLALVLDNKSRPRPTMGTIIALGDDPYMYELIMVQGKKRQRWQVGDVVSYAWTAGHYQVIEDHEFRNITWQDITGTFRPEPEQPQDLLNAPEQDAQTLPSLARGLTASPYDTSYRESLPDEPIHTVHPEIEQGPEPIPYRSPQPHKRDS